jgi:hypothetical protein
MKKIALVGENPLDTEAIRNLLEQKYKEEIEYVFLVKNLRGSDLDNKKMYDMVRLEYYSEMPDIVIFIRDLDAVQGQKHYKENLKRRKEYFQKMAKVTEDKALPLLNIYELEALILADIARANKFYGTSAIFEGSPMLQNEPKEWLQKACKYKTSDMGDIFKKLRIEVVAQNCAYFAEFIQVFEERIAQDFR